MVLRLFLWPLTLCALAACTDAPASESASSDPPPRTSAPDAVGVERIRGVTLDARREPPPSLLPALADLGATHVTVIPFAFQRRTDSPELRTNYDADWYTEGRAGIRALARQADTLGMRLVIKPQIWIRDGWSADIAFAHEDEWSRWETAYRDFALAYARLSAEIGAPLFVIGTELGRVGHAREAFWRALIAEIRTVYEGELTYAANWHEGFEHIPFWDALDYIGVQAYFPLSEDEAPSMPALRQGWHQHEAALGAVHRRTGKPVLFTELGYRDVPFAAARPWEWPPHQPAVADPDPALQARLYTAFFEEVWPEPWMAGAILWKWHPPGRDYAGDFTPQGKPAEAVIRDAFNAAHP
jgi:hypothetical protein